MGAVFDRKAWAAEKGIEAGALAVGSKISLNVSGSARSFLVVNQGLPFGKDDNLTRPATYDESCDGTWLLMEDLYETLCMWHSSNRNSYAASSIHAYLNGTFLSLFDSHIQASIKQIKIPYVNGTADAAVADGANGLSTRIFLLSHYELGWEHFLLANAHKDGRCLEYFYNLTVNSPKRIAYRNGTASAWWLRTPWTSDNFAAGLVSAKGNWTSASCTASWCVRPALILPSDFKLTKSADGKLFAA